LQIKEHCRINLEFVPACSRRVGLDDDDDQSDQSNKSDLFFGSLANQTCYGVCAILGWSV
jgi:hypothetical protein